MDRREFIKQSCFACMALGAGAVIPSLSSCTTLPIVKTDIESKKIIIDPASFTDGAQSILVRAKKLDHDILVIKNPDNTYRALYMRCTHNQFSLSCNKSQIFCTSHGAEFDFEGNVTKGPAVKKLLSFPIILENGKIIIAIS